MKNLIKSMCVVLCGMMISATFIACEFGDDDDIDNDSVDSRVVGTWTSTISEGWNWNEDGVLSNHWEDLSAIKTRSYEVVDGRETGRFTDYTHEVPEWTTVTFNSDGSCIEEDEEGSSRGTFTAKGNVMTLYAAGGADIFEYSFDKDGNLILVSEEYEGGVRTEKEIIRFVKGLYQAGM